MKKYLPYLGMIAVFALFAFSIKNIAFPVAHNNLPADATIPATDEVEQVDPTIVKTALLRKGIYFGDYMVNEDIRQDAPRPSNFLTTVAPYFSMYSIPSWYHRVEYNGPGKFDFRDPDQVADFAVKQNAKIHAHNLVYNILYPPWLATGTFTPEQLQDILKTHVQTVVAHFRDKYPGRVIAWDTVNEPICDSYTPAANCTSDGLRITKWSVIHYPGSTDPSDYIAMAFQWAHETDPNVKLYINEGGIEHKGQKWDQLLALVTKLKSHNVPIDGIGFQSHLDTHYAYPLSELTDNMNILADMGMDSQVSEFDVLMSTAVTLPWTAKPIDNPTVADYAAQARLYKDTLNACIVAKHCSAFIMYGEWDPGTFADATWKDPSGAYYKPFRPNILNADLKQKPAFIAMADEVRQAIPLPDTTAPTIAVTGDADMTITQGDNYTDGGASASDDTDGDISSKISIDNKVDTTAVGDYVVKYTVKDAAGNSASATRTVHVVTKPADTSTNTNTSSGGGGYVSGGGGTTTTVTSPVVTTPTQVFTPLPPVTVPVPPAANLVVPTVASGFWSFLPFIAATPKPAAVITPTAPAVHTNTKTGKKSYDIVSAEYSLNGTVVHTATTYPDDWTLDTGTLADGQYTLSSVFKYTDGTTDGTSSTFTVDNSPTIIERIVAYIQNLLKK